MSDDPVPATQKAARIDMSGKIALVTGAGSGIGRASALAFAAAEAVVVVADFNGAGAAQTVAMIEANGGVAWYASADISDAVQVDELIAKVVERHGRLDFAHNNAGVESALAPMADSDERDVDRNIAVNLKGVWLCMRAEIRQMVKTGGGAIVNTSSVGGLVAVPGAGVYSAAKHGVIGLTKTAAIEYAKQNIRVNAICPGLTKSGMTERLEKLDPALIAAVMPPMGRMAQPAEIGAFVVFMCSDMSSYLTGQAVAVDGGATAI
jgi:NAD(P)-dependent dehydrogenase (short-subunit alcohol dehydrogenase family)